MKVNEICFVCIYTLFQGLENLEISKGKKNSSRSSRFEAGETRKSLVKLVIYFRALFSVSRRSEKRRSFQDWLSAQTLQRPWNLVFGLRNKTSSKVKSLSRGEMKDTYLKVVFLQILNIFVWKLKNSTFFSLLTKLQPSKSL